MLNKLKQLKSVIFRSLKKAIVNINWAFFRLFVFKPNVMNEEKTIKLILQKRLSITRFGDGEFRLMTHNGEIGFQKEDINLSKKLIEAFNTRNRRLLVCCFDFRKKRYMNNYAGNWLKNFIFYHYKKIKPLFDCHYLYGNAEITRFYNPAYYEVTDFDYLKTKYIPLLKSLWKEREVLIVEGSETKLGIGNDLFHECRSIRRIICPAYNAFEKYSEIYDSIIKNIPHKDVLVLVALGPTASIIARDLTINEGLQCLDIGHVDIVYLWFLNKSKNADNIDGKFVNESKITNDTIHIEFDEVKYNSEIVSTIY